MQSTNPPERSYLNVLGKPLEKCNCSPLTGWYRDGYCKTDNADIGMHTVCCVMTKSFLSYSKAQGNDLLTPLPEYNFPGIKPGEKWCLCAMRWKQAYEDGMAPKVCLKATEISTLNIIRIELLVEHAMDET